MSEIWLRILGAGMMKKQLFLSATGLLAAGFLSACSDKRGSETGISADQWPSISGDYKNRASEIAGVYGLPVSEPVTAVAAIPVAAPVKVMAAPAPVTKPVVKQTAAKTSSSKARSFGSVLVAGNDDIKVLIPKRVAKKAVTAASANREVFAFGGYDVVAGRATLNDSRADRNFIVFFKQAGQENVLGPRMDTEVLPFIRQATGCNVAHAAGERRLVTLPMDKTVVVPISCGKV
jgi:hypothetical protein